MNRTQQLNIYSPTLYIYMPLLVAASSTLRSTHARYYCLQSGTRAACRKQKHVAQKRETYMCSMVVLGGCVCTVYKTYASTSETFEP